MLAPTGTIGFMMDCDTTGIEPDIALIKYKKLVGGGMLKIVNSTVPPALKKLGYPQPEIEAIIDYLDKNDTIEGAPFLKAEHLPVFDCAFKPAKGSRSIHYLGHLRMMARGAAVPLRRDLEDGEPADRGHRRGHRAGLPRGVEAGAQGGGRLPRRLQEEPAAQHRAATRRSRRQGVVAERVARRRLPDERRAITHKFSVAGHEGYLTVGMYEDGQPGELFITMAKEGSTVSGLMDSFATAISLALQYGVPLKVLVRQVQPHALRAVGLHRQPRHPDRQVDHRLHLPLAGA